MAGGVKAIVLAMKAHPGSTRVQTQGTTLLVDLTGDAVSRGAATRGAAEEGSIEVVVAALLRDTESAAFAEVGARCLAQLLESPAAQKRAAVAGAVGALVGAMRRHDGVPAVSEAACSALAALAAGSDANQVAVAAAGGVDSVVGALRGHDTLAAVSRAALAALAALAPNHDSDLICALESAGAVEVAVGQMEALAGAGHVQEAGCRFLGALTASDDAKFAAVKAGALETVLLALRAHSHSEGVATEAACALWNLVYNEGAERRACSEGGCEAVVGAMRDFRRSERLQAAGCGLLACLSFNETTKARCVQAGGIEVVVAALRSHRKNVQVAEQACQAIWNFTAYDQHELNVAAAGGIEAVVSAMRAHEKNGLVQESGCAILCNFACNAGHAEVLGALDAQGAVKSALRGHDRHGGVQEQGARALVIFSSSIMADAFEAAADAAAKRRPTPAQLLLGEAGAKSKLSGSAPGAANSTEPGSAGGLRWALSDPELFSHECLRARDRAVHAVKRAAMLKEGAAELVCKGMAMYLANADVQQSGCRALANLALGDVRNILTVSGAATAVIEAVVAAMRQHPKDEVVQEYSCWALAYITWSSKDAKTYAARPRPRCSSNAPFACCRCAAEHAAMLTRASPLRSARWALPHCCARR